MEHFDILNMILADKAADYEDFRNILVSSDIDEKRIKSLAKRQKLEKLKFLNFDEMENAGDIAAFFTNMEEDQTLICRYSEYQSEQIKELIEGMLRSRSFELILGSDEDPQIKTIFCGGFSIIMLKEKYLTVPSDTLSLFHLKILINDAEIEVKEIEFEEDDDENTSSNFGETSEGQFKYVPKNKKSIYEIQGLEKDGTFLYVETCYRSGEIWLSEPLSSEEIIEEEIVFNNYVNASYFDAVDTEYDYDGDDEELEEIKTAWQEDGLSGLEEIGWSQSSISIKIIGGVIELDSNNQEKKGNSTNMSASIIELQFDLENGDTGERVSDIAARIEIENQALAQVIEEILENYSTENLKNLLKAIYDNPEMDSSSSEMKGAGYQKLWSILSQYAYDKLGWHDAQASVTEIIIDGRRIEISEEDMEYILGQEMRLQLVRDDGFMYIIG
jgi:hypothetical protein